MDSKTKDQPSAKESKQVQPIESLGFSTNFASLSLHQNDRIRLLAFPVSIIDLIRVTITSSWPRGIQAERTYAGSHQFKLYGTPWLGSGEEAMSSRRLMQHILATLWDIGWLLSFSTDVSKKQKDKDTLIFRHQTPAPPPCDWISVSFSRHDRLRFMDAPTELLDAVTTVIQPSIQERMNYTKTTDTWEVKLRGYPWLADGEETMATRLLLLKLVAVLEDHGFTVYASIDQKATVQEKRSESDTWHCRRLRDWTSGAPVYHN